MLKSIYSHGAYSERALGLHLAAPLLEERERFLQHLRREGATQRALKRVEQGLIKTIRCFRLKNLRDVELCEVHRACSRWQGRRHNWRVSLAHNSGAGLPQKELFFVPRGPKGEPVDQASNLFREPVIESCRGTLTIQ